MKRRLIRHPGLANHALDMIFRDDECRIRTDHAPANFTTVKHMALNLIRRAPGKDSLRLRRKVAAWDDDFLAASSPRKSFTRFPWLSRAVTASGLRRLDPFSSIR